MKNIESIKRTIQGAVEKRKKTATFHSQVLLHAEVLEHLDPAAFCRDVGVPATYHIEFRKMIAAAHALSELGYSIQKRWRRGLTMRCSERRRAVAVAIGASRGRRR